MILKKFDVYIIKKYLSSFFFTMFLITLVGIVIDYSEKISKFINADLNFFEVMLNYYLYFIPWINGLMWPLFSLIAVIFFTSRLAKDSEIIALLSGGVSIYRIIVPYLIAAGIISILLWAGKNYLIPHSNKLKNEFEAEYLHKNIEQTLENDIHFYLNPYEKIFIRRYIKRDSSGRIFRLEKFKDGNLVEVLKAEKLSFKESPNLWTIENYSIRKIDGINEGIKVSNSESLDTLLDLTPEDFTRNTKGMENMNTSDLKDYIRRKKDRGIGAEKNYLVELYLRSAQPFAIIILTIIGFAIASRKIRGGMGLHLAIGVIIGAAYVVVSQFSSTFSNNLSLEPILGAWLPNAIFGIIAIGLLLKSQK
jgi:lipopolysaccharide export system permease protein